MDNHYNQDNDYFNSKSNAEKYNLNNDRYTQTNDNYQRYKHNNQYNNSNEFNQPKSSVKRIIYIITTIYFIASIIGIVINLGTNMPLALILFGQLFFVIGIGSFIISKNKKDDLKLLIFPFIGAIIMITSGTNLLSYQELINKLTDFAPLMIIALCFLLGLGLVLSAVISEKRAEARCQVEIEAVIIDYKRKWASSKKTARFIVLCMSIDTKAEHTINGIKNIIVQLNQK